MEVGSLVLVKGPFCDPSVLILWHNSVDIDKISLFPNFQSIQFWVCLCELCMFQVITVSYCAQAIMRGIYYANIINQQIADYFPNNSICRKHFVHKHYVQASTKCRNLNSFLEKNGGGMRLWIRKWAFNAKSTMFYDFKML